MGIAKSYNRVLHNELTCRGAWLPIANTFRLGDYGLISEGVFKPMNNLADRFGLELRAGPKSPASKLEFASPSTKMVRFAAGVSVDVLPDTPIEARLEVTFEQAKSLLLKSKSVTSQALTNVDEIAEHLAAERRWNHRWRIVREVWTAEHALILCTRDANTKVSFGASAGVLKRLELGDVDLDIAVEANKHVGLQLVGDSGIVGLGLFRVRMSGGTVLRSSGSQTLIDRDDDAIIELEDDI